MDQFYLVVYNSALQVFFTPEPAGSSEERAKEYAKLKQAEVSQIGCQTVHLLKEVKY